jgi:putative lipoprotein
MRLFQLFVVLLSLIYLNACQSEQRGGQQKGEAEEITSDMDKPVPQADFTGIYSQGEGYQEFKNCSDYSIYALAEGSVLSNKYDSLGLSDGTPMFVQLSGKTDSTGKSATNRLDVQSVLLVEKYRGQEACPVFGERTFKFTGNEPFWSLTVTPDSMTFNHFEREPFTYPHHGPIWQDSVWVLESALQESDFAVFVSEANCQDDMSGRQYDMTVSIRTEMQTYRGCGGWAKRDQAQPKP